MKKVFCVEDDENIRELVVYTLSQTGFSSMGFEDAACLFNELKTQKPDLILLDIMLPGIDGNEILRRLKKSDETKNIPVIMLTAKSAQMDKIKGLDSGADDYITKPFDIMELVSRTNAVLRRTQKSDGENIIKIGGIEINKKHRSVFSDEKEVKLTFKEFELLYYLAQNRGIVMGRESLMNKIWGTDFEGETRTIDVHIKTLRQKLGDEGKRIETVRNVGYKIN